MVGVGAIALVVIAPFVLRLLNPAYIDLHGSVVIAILAVGSFCRTVYVIWAALQRARRRMRPLLILNGISSVFIFAALVPMSLHWGAVGAAAVISAAQIILSGGALLDLFKEWIRARNV